MDNGKRMASNREVVISSLLRDKYRCFLGSVVKWPLSAVGAQGKLPEFGCVCPLFSFARISLPVFLWV
ncbi:MAG: hypothetical protein IPL65_05635 [Lewinellaceae bacterium]|nr:hypothetical protein [Lewinellaceae bacterium]